VRVRRVWLADGTRDACSRADLTSALSTFDAALPAAGAQDRPRHRARIAGRTAALALRLGMHRLAAQSPHEAGS
jgi:hypothetical protein